MGGEGIFEIGEFGHIQAEFKVLFFQFVRGLTLAMDEVQDRSISMGKGS